MVSASGTAENNLKDKSVLQSYISVNILHCSTFSVWCTNLDRVVLSQSSHCCFALIRCENKRDDIAIADRHSDSLFIEINIKDGKNLIVGVTYRPPNADLDTFNIKLEETLFSINEKNKNCILLRDFNIDLCRDDAAKNNFINTLHSFSFFPTINTFTRVTHSTKSIIDNIITNIRNTPLESGVVLSKISDPLLYYFLTLLAGPHSYVIK